MYIYIYIYIYLSISLSIDTHTHTHAHTHTYIFASFQKEDARSIKDRASIFFFSGGGCQEHQGQSEQLQRHQRRAQKAR